MMNKKTQTLLLVDDDDVFRQVLARAMIKRGFEVVTAANVDDAIPLAEKHLPRFAVVDLKMPGPNGLVLVEKLKQLNNEMRIVMLTGYASVATAVEAIKLGATHYLPKPADADDIIAALGRDEGDADIETPDAVMSVSRVEWEHIQRVLNEHDGNISAAARSLNMHRRTLQRKLAKKPVLR
jgi:two-component system response regulator RegA